MSHDDEHPLDSIQRAEGEDARRRREISDPETVAAAWSTDAELRRLIAAVNSIQPRTWKGAWQNHPMNADYKAANDALVTYINQNRSRLGIPEGHYVHPRTGQVYKPKGTDWVKFGLL